MPASGNPSFTPGLTFSVPAWPIAVAVVFGASVTFLIDILTPLGWGAPFLHVLVVFLALMLPRAAHALIAAAACTALTAAGAALSPPAGELAPALFNRALALVLIWALILFDRVRRAARRTLAEREEDLSSFLDNAPIGIHLVAPDGRILWANRCELEQLGYDEQEYVGRHIAEFHADRTTAEAILSRLAANVTIDNVEARLLRKDGTTLWAAISSNVYRRQGRFVHTRCFTRDISERKQAEEVLRRSREALETLAEARTAELRGIRAALEKELAERRRAEAALIESEGRLRAILDNSPAVIFMKDTDGRYLHVNRQFEKRFGLVRAQIIGRTDAELFSPEQAAAFRANDLRVRQAGGAARVRGDRPVPGRTAYEHRLEVSAA